MTPALKLTGEGAPVEMWLLHLPAPWQAQRRAARDWLAAELARRDPATPPDWTETSKGPRMPRGARWHSSFSYCGPYILCGLSRQGVPGVDLTGAQVWPGDADVLALYCGPRAAAELAASPPSGRADVFARAWSALEARLKACRRGLEEYSPQRERHLASARLTCQIRHQGLWAAAALCGSAPGAGQGA
ncbi:4'-phosphopantetheinyl transferase superfamily protein [Achromobacter sp. SD115]|uniref:4'-phosphopantetheinyl transferase family protein n=1 Tax=Achromobacter sp. SD115 TaxID=2782011 RepID=UPI001A96B884|nr:4'-phosphopantetheinyl transferase superfamily protein [Achromobacter sp. SD115]